MKNVTTKKWELAPALMARVDACAYIFIADKPGKISAIMESRGVMALEAGRIYTIGALKVAKRRGTARNYREAIEALENEQAGDRGNPLTRTISADKTANIIARCNKGRLPGYYSNKRIDRETGEYTRQGKPIYQYAGLVSEYIQGMSNNTPMRTNTVDVVRMAWAHMDNQPLTAYADSWNWHIQEDKKPEIGKDTSHTLNIGKVLGSMYTDIEQKQEQSDPAYVFANTHIKLNYYRYFREYESRLSKTVKMRLAELKGYVNRESKGDTDKAEQAVKYLMSNRGKAAPETSKTAVFADHLHRNFEHNKAVTCPEFIGLLCRYCNAM
jgi:hypothetical protein